MVQEAEVEKAKGLLSRFKNDHMTKLLDLLDIPRSELKDKVTRFPTPLVCHRNLTHHNFVTCSFCASQLEQHRHSYIVQCHQKASKRRFTL